LVSLVTANDQLIYCDRFLCHAFHDRQDSSELAISAQAGAALSKRRGQKQPIRVFEIWQAVASQEQGMPKRAARFFSSRSLSKYSKWVPAAVLSLACQHNILRLDTNNWTNS
jgi:hypothetical protein